TLDWVLGFQDLVESNRSYGAVTLGEEHPDSISTEANVDALAAAWGMAQALKDFEAGHPYRRAAEGILRWLGKSWTGDRFLVSARKPGGVPLEFEEWLDSQTWTVLALEATGALDPPRHRQALLSLADREVQVHYEGRWLRGFGKVSDPKVESFWSEGVAGYVLAARALGLPEEPYLESLDAARKPDGSLPYTIGPRGEGPAWWKIDLRLEGVDGTVWASWADAEVNFNPFRTGGFGSATADAGRRSGARAQLRAERSESFLRSLEAERGRLRGLEKRVEDLLRELRGE
ncbi:MAG: hypothetical protein ACRD2T_14030, partial [Thermoanaerobaculia bacterium]